VTTDESDAWAELAGKGEAPPSRPFAEILAQVRAQGPGGFDPGPSLRALAIPVFWVFADDDRNVPTQLCVERVQALAADHDFRWTIVHATHTLLDVPSGLNVDIVDSRGFASALFPSVGDWLRSRGVV
jgi:pimeloyl-ACP methyl ester carboxylesterase